MKRLVLTLIFTLSVTLFAFPACSQMIRLRGPNTFADRDFKPSCKECYIQQVEIMVPSNGKIIEGADPICSVPKVVDFFQITAAAIRSKLDPNASGDLSEIAKRVAYQEVRKKVGTSFQTYLDEKETRSPYGNCAPLGAVIPRDAILEEI